MSLRLQIILSVIAIVVAVAGLGAAINYRHEYANNVGDVMRSLHEQAGALRAARERIPDEQQYMAYVEAFCKQMSDTPAGGHQIFLLDPAGKLLMHTPHGADGDVQPLLAAAEAKQAIVPVADHDLAHVSVKAADATTIIVAEYLDEAKSISRQELLSRAVETAAITLAVVGLLTLMLDRLVLRPLGGLTAAARALAAGKLASRAELGGCRDLRVVQEEFNHMARRVEASDQSLRRSNSDLQEFGHVVSHDLREPLRAISLFVELLEKRCAGGLDEKAREYMGYITGGTRRMNALISDLLKYSQVGAKAPQPGLVDATECVRVAVSNLQVAIKEAGAAVTYDRLPKVFAEEGQLVQVFQNLIANAVKFRGSRPCSVRAGARQDGAFWVFEVRDNGIGIAREDAERVFGVFQRLHTQEEYPGTGMGLSICKKVIERGGGRIWIESELGKGAAFLFTVPAAGEATEAAAD